jgi:carboxymethylenebutenolidase
MADLQQYILEEWAEEFTQGRMGRREFLRRVALMSGGAALALPVLRTLGVVASTEEVVQAAASAPAAAAPAPGITVPPDDPAITVRSVTFPSGTVQVQGYLATPRAGGPAPGVLIIHENRGLLEHFRDVARRLAKVGYAGMAVDLASPIGGTARYSDLAQVTAFLGQTPPEQHVTLLNATVRYLQEQAGVRRDRLGTMGYCFGGGMVWRLATANPDLRAAVPYYGANPPLEDVPKIKAAVLALYGEMDTRINAGIPAIREALQRANVVHEIVVYPNAGHAFFNDTGGAYSTTAAAEAWRRTLAWFDRYLKG